MYFNIKIPTNTFNVLYTMISENTLLKELDLINLLEKKHYDTSDMLFEQMSILGISPRFFMINIPTKSNTIESIIINDMKNVFDFIQKNIYEDRFLKLSDLKLNEIVISPEY